MTIVTVSLPPGMYMNGTPYDQKQRWNDGNRVRWHNDALRPIGGWQVMTNDSGNQLPPLSSDMSTTVYRDGFTWVDNNNARYYAFGANNALKILLPDQTITDVTPSGLIGSPPQPTVNVGYGRWLYGRVAYGTPRPITTGQTTRLWRWTFDMWGEDLLAGANDTQYYGGIYSWDASAQPSEATPVSNAPTDQNGFVVTDQRIVMCIGSTTEARLVRWSDREDYTDWTPTQTNYAGSFFLQGSGRLVSIDKVLNQVLILSENDAHVARYIGAPLVFGFDRVGNGCGPWNAQCVYVTDRFAIWPGRRNFWMYDGTLKPVECPLMDFLAADVDTSVVAKAYAISVPQFSEVWWFYQSKSGDEVDSYMVFDYFELSWTKGRMARTAGAAGEVYVNPVLVDEAQQINIHEMASLNVDDAWASTGPLEIEQGETNMAVRYMYPDTQSEGDVTYTLFGREMPTAEMHEYGPYVQSNPISTRAMGREISMRVDGEDKSNWKVGNKMRFDVAPVGTGRR